MTMKSLVSCVFVGFAVVAATPGHVLSGFGRTSAAPQRFDSDDWCRQQNWGNDRAGVCEVRELTFASAGSLMVDASPNGGIKVEGAPRYDIQMRARVVATAMTEDRARQIASAVRIQPAGDRIEADGPSGLGQREGWHVSYELSVPMQTNLSLKSTNGGVSIRDVEGRLEFTTTNGGVKLANVGGDVRGRTTNGGVDIELDGATWRGEGLDVQTSNGGVKIAIPDDYSAQLQVGTTNGGMNSDFPIAVKGRLNRDIDATLGGGGAPIRVRTSNGGVRITKK
jgi:putative adhesin